MKFYEEKNEKVFMELKTSMNGLSESEAKNRLEKDGKNKLKEAKKISLFKRFLDQLMDPMIIILIIAAIISGIVSYIQKEGFADVIIIMIVVIVNAVLGVAQESKAEKAIEALQKMAASKSNVLRDDTIKTIYSEDLVKGDIIFLEAGDAIPADVRIIESASLKIEEAALTGESVPVEKISEELVCDNKDIPLGDRKNMAYMGSNVVYGRGKAVITSTGMDTEMGKIAGALSLAEDEQTPLQIKMAQLSKVLTKIVVGICILVFVTQLIRSHGYSFEPVLNSFMIAVSLAVAAIPEGLAAVVTVVLSIGVTNMSKRNAIIRKLTAVETLGCAQIICSDKTGTLTQNKMTVVDYFGDNKEKIEEAMALCNDANLDDSNEVIGEPTEAALVSWAYKNGMDKRKLSKIKNRCKEIPFDSMRKLMTTVHQDGDGYVQYTKGAPDVVLEHCTHILVNNCVLPMNDELHDEIVKQNKKMADKALRVLACAKRNWDELPDVNDAENIESNLCFVGLCGMIDPIRPEVKDAISECKEAGIQPIMITGDHIDTAIAIAKDLGIYKGEGSAMTGMQLNELSDEEFNKCFKDICVYARVQPEHKTRIVNAWKKAGYVTAMTGDGVNDAPSIKSADIGIGMGITGTDVTKNVADMILADDNFATIVGAVEEGRRIYDNIRKAIQFLLSSNMSEVLSIFSATLIGFTILKPVHLLWINLVTDCFPALALGMEKGEPNLMQRKPRDSHDGIFANGVGTDIVYQGLMVTILTLLSYFIGLHMETGGYSIVNSGVGTTMAFLTMSMAEMFHSLNMRSQRESIFALKTKNMFLFIAIIVSLIATTIVCKVPVLANAFEFTNISWNEYFIAMLLAFLVIPIVEIVKYVQRKGKKH